ncbi:MAG: acyl carrier protein [Gemmatimonadota bacterium]|nr:acyl carrier protein [Gemmatimonadota bacterium]
MTELDARLREMLGDLVRTPVPQSGDVQFGALAGWDSVTHLHLLLDVERTFDVTIPDDVGVRLDSLSKLHDYIAAHRGPGAG